MDDQILTLIITLVPSAASVIAIIVTAIKIWKSFSSLKASIKDKTESDELKRKMESLMSQNRELQKLLILELETKTRIRGGGVKTNEQSTGVGNDKEV